MVLFLKTMKPAYSDWQTALMFSILELDGLLVGSGEVPSVDLEKRAPMRFVIMLMVLEHCLCHKEA